MLTRAKRSPHVVAAYSSPTIHVDNKCFRPCRLPHAPTCSHDIILVNLRRPILCTPHTSRKPLKRCFWHGTAVTTLPTPPRSTFLESSHVSTIHGRHSTRLIYRLRGCREDPRQTLPKSELAAVNHAGPAGTLVSCLSELAAQRRSVSLLWSIFPTRIGPYVRRLSIL